MFGNIGKSGGNAIVSENSVNQVRKGLLVFSSRENFKKSCGKKNCLPYFAIKRTSRNLQGSSSEATFWKFSQATARRF